MTTEEGPGGYTPETLTHHLMTRFTPADTYSWPHLPKELFRAGYFFREQAQALMCGNTRCHTEKNYARPSRKLVHDRLPSHPPCMPCSSHLRHVSNLASSSSRGRLAGCTIRMMPSPEVAFRSEGPGVSLGSGVVDTRAASVGMHTALKL